MLRRAGRGERVKEIRVDRGEGQEQFAGVLEERLRALGVPSQFDKSKVSKTERGGRDLTPEEVAVLVEIDPAERGLAWLVFGRETSRKKAVAHTDTAMRRKPASRRAANG